MLFDKFLLKSECCCLYALINLCFVLKDAAFNLVLRVILSIKTSEIEKTIAQLDRDQIDMLMKYVYKGFENPSEGRSAHLLAWHEKVNKKS